MTPQFATKRGARVAHIRCPLRRNFTICGLPIEDTFWTSGRERGHRTCASCNRIKDAYTVVREGT